MEDDALSEVGRFWPHDRPRVYANHLQIALNLSEIELSFAQLSKDGGIVANNWVLTTPVHLASFGQAIRRTIARYEARYGLIPGVDGNYPPPGKS